MKIPLLAEKEGFVKIHYSNILRSSDSKFHMISNIIKIGHESCLKVKSKHDVMA